MNNIIDIKKYLKDELVNFGFSISSKHNHFFIYATKEENNYKIIVLINDDLENESLSNKTCFSMLVVYGDETIFLGKINIISLPIILKALHLEPLVERNVISEIIDDFKNKNNG